MSRQYRIRATYMRGGTSKGVFFLLKDLPDGAQLAGPARDQLLARIIGSPDPYGKHTDGMGGATSSTSKVVIIAASERPGHDVDYWFGQVSIDQDLVDWSGNCGNLSAAVGGFAIRRGVVDPARIPHNGICEIRIWQANIERTIVAHVPICDGEVQEQGDFELDGVTFPAAEVRLEFYDSADASDPTTPNPTISAATPSSPDTSARSEALFPTGQVAEELDIPGVGRLQATLINSGIPTIFVNAADLGYTGTELQADINQDRDALVRFERIRAHGALMMGLINELSEAAVRQHTPKVAFVAPPADYVTSSGRHVSATEIDVLVRALSMGQLHHAMMGTATICIGVAAAIPGTVVNLAAGAAGRGQESVTFGHPSGTTTVGAEIVRRGDGWQVSKATMSRSARTLMDGWVYVGL